MVGLSVKCFGLHSCQVTGHVLLLLVSYARLLPSLSLSPRCTCLSGRNPNCVKLEIHIVYVMHADCLLAALQPMQLLTHILPAVWLCASCPHPTCTSHLNTPDFFMIYWWLQLIACAVADGCGSPKAAKDGVQPFGGQCGVHCARQHCSGSSADSAGGPSGPVGTSGQVSTHTCYGPEYVQ